MIRTEFLQVLGYFLLIFFTSTLLGLTIIGLLRRLVKEEKERTTPIEIIGAGLLTGIGIIAYLALAVGLAGVYTKTALLAVIIACLAISFKQIFPLIKSSLEHIRNLAMEYKKDVISLLVTVLAVITLASLYLTAMQPPYTSDELHYHLPEVRQIVNAEKVELDFGGHPFYGNIPKLMEIVFAMGKTLSSYQLSHALNFSIFLGFLLVVFGIIKKHYGIKVASLSFLFLAWFDDFTWNATSGFIDAATTSFEIAALLFILDWSSNKSRVSFYLSAILIGISASIKYSPLPTAAFILAIILYKLFKDHQLKLVKALKIISPYVLVAVLFGGFWYIKNLIKFRNPFYPLYFGHPGYEEEQFKSLLGAIHEFGPKTPAYFYKQLSGRFLTTTQFFVFLSVFVSPIIIFVKKQNKFRVALFAYFTIYTLYWFFIATHQVRFLAPALLVSLITLAILTTRVKARYFATVTFLILTASLLYSALVRSIDFKAVWKGFWDTKFHLVERQYGLGNVSRAQFLVWHFGCQYSVINYLETNSLPGSVIDNWSVWFAPSVSFHAEKNHFQSYASKGEPFAETLQRLKQGNFRYVYLNSKIKEKALKSTDPIVTKSIKPKLILEDALLKNASLIYKDDTCYLHKINF